MKTTNLTADIIAKHPYISTFAGLRLYPDDPRPEQISLVDLANGLGKEGRFGNQCDEFYSVAQHSILLAEYLPKEYRLWAMLHDASEAYTGDMLSPVKPTVAGWKAFEDSLSRCIFGVFGLVWENVPTAVKEADARIAIDEALVVFDTPPTWVKEHRTHQLGVAVHPWSKTVSKFVWLRYMYALLGKAVPDTEVARQLRIKQPLGKTFRNPTWA